MPKPKPITVKEAVDEKIVNIDAKRISTAQFLNIIKSNNGIRAVTYNGNKGPRNINVKKINLSGTGRVQLIKGQKENTGSKFIDRKAIVAIKTTVALAEEFKINYFI